TLISMANLASTYRNQGRWKEAEKLGMQVTDISKKTLGTEYPDTLNSMANLASTYWNQGRWKEAKKLEELRQYDGGAVGGDALVAGAESTGVGTRGTENVNYSKTTRRFKLASMVQRLRKKFFITDQWDSRERGEAVEETREKKISDSKTKKMLEVLKDEETREKN
ncbi:hypothetical protein MMC14_008829, partial [Varicellaria rhodocarpa]|nr:hypothetical protein [Varicellaria rhodocarpa]